MSDILLEIDVAYARPGKQVVIPVKVLEGTNVQQAIKKSGVLKQCTEINLTNMLVGVFGKICKLEVIVEQGDRIEIYRPLLQSPMDARRSRAGNK